MLSLNFHHLYYFWVTAKRGSIGEAGRELFLSRPALSLQLKTLEASLGRNLMHRSHQGISLTPQGRAVFDYCEKIFVWGERLAASVREGAATAPPALHVGVEETIPQDVVVSLFDKIRRRSGKIRVCLYGGALADLQERLGRYAIDLLISDVDLSMVMGMEFISRLKENIPVVFVGSPSLLRGFKRFPRDLAKMPLLLRGRGNPVRNEVEAFLGRHGIEVRVDSEIEDVDLIRHLALRGVGVAALNRMMVEKDLRTGRLVVLHRRPLGIAEPAWFTAARNPHADPEIDAIIQSALSSFSSPAPVSAPGRRGLPGPRSGARPPDDASSG